VSQDIAGGKFELYDLEADPKESKDLSSERPELAGKMRQALLDWNKSVEASVAGKDYPEGKVAASEPPSRDWVTAPEYQKYLPELRKRPEYAAAIEKSPTKAKGRRAPAATP
jgi:hypothetical protein